MLKTNSERQQPKEDKTLRGWKCKTPGTQALLLGMQNGEATSTFALRLVVNTSNPASLYLPKWSEIMCSHKNLYEDLYSRLFCKWGKKLRKKWKTDRLWYMYLTVYNSVIKQITDALNNTDESEMHHASWKKSDSKATYHISAFIGYSEKAKQ